MPALKKSNINRLHGLGYSGYREYLNSDHWARVRRAYRTSGRPLTCVVCGDRSIQLHHRSYTRLGNERLNDVIPLCRDCHGLVHDYIDTHPGQIIQATNVILRRIFGWSKPEMHRRMAPFDASDGLREIR